MRSGIQMESRQPGVTLVTILVITLALSCMLAVIGTFTVVSSSRAEGKANSAAAVGMAEAGLNYELHKISQNSVYADQLGFRYPPGVTYDFSRGTFRVYCTNRDGTFPWIPPNNLYIYSTGTYNGVSHTIKIAAKGVSTRSNTFALYALKTAVFRGKVTVTGNVGTNGSLIFESATPIHGAMALNGPRACVSGSFTVTHTTHNPNSVRWPTVHDIAIQKFPLGGLAWLSQPGHNDNNLVSAIHNNSLTASSGQTITFRSKPGGANYYLTNMNMQDRSSIRLDNSLGPVTLWLGPDGESGYFHICSDIPVVPASNDPNKACRIYLGSSSTCTVESNSMVDLGIYAFNRNPYKQPIGTVELRRVPAFKNSIIANTILFESNTQVTFVPGTFPSARVDYYVFDRDWDESNGR